LALRLIAGRLECINRGRMLVLTATCELRRFEPKCAVVSF
jgi:hypothetical protein